jgi:hypothetical protein
MRYRIVFAGSKVGQSQMPPFETDVPDAYGVAERTVELSRLIRNRVVQALTYAPAPGASDARPVIEENTQIVVMLNAGQGAAHYGTTTLGTFDLYPIP